MPRPSSLPRQPRFVDTDRTLKGADYTNLGGWLGWHVTTAGDALSFSPAWSPPGPHRLDDSACACFEFSLTDYNEDPVVDLSWDTPPPDPGNLWIGVANWTANRWDWWQYTGAAVDFGSVAPHQDDPNGICVVLVLLGTDPAVLNWVRIGLGEWRITVVDSTASVGRYDSLALDSAGEPHISYWNEDSKDLKYASRSGTTWTTETVDSTGDVGQYTSLALDSADHPHISYFDATNKDLKYATNGGGGWTLTAIDPTSDLGYYTSLALDSAGHPHIAYFDDSAVAVCYASFDGATWHGDYVDLQGMNDYMSLAIDGADHPHIAYRDPTGIQHAYNNGTAWSFDTVYSLATGGLSGSRVLACTSLGGLHIVFCDGATSTAHLAVFSSGAWSESELPFGTNAGTNASLAIDSSGMPHMTQYASGMEYDRYDGSAWHRTTVDGQYGWHTSLVLDTNDKPRVSYHRPPDHTLCYAEYVN